MTAPGTVAIVVLLRQNTSKSIKRPMPRMDEQTVTMRSDLFRATYLIETPLEPARVADVMAGEQSCGTFARVEGETDELRARAGPWSKRSRSSSLVIAPACRMPSSSAKGFRVPGGVRGSRSRSRSPTSAPTCRRLPQRSSGNLYDLGELTGLRLESMCFRRRIARSSIDPQLGVCGHAQATGVEAGPLHRHDHQAQRRPFTPRRRRARRPSCAMPAWTSSRTTSAAPTPSTRRLPIACVGDGRRARARRTATGKRVMFAFNITDEQTRCAATPSWWKREGGSCVMVSLNWCGLSAVQTLRRHTGLAIHGHRNGFGMLSRHPLLGMSFQAYQTLWRLAGVDHMHVHGLQGKFAQTDARGRRLRARLPDAAGRSGGATIA